MKELLEAERKILSERCRIVRLRGSEQNLIKAETYHEQLSRRYRYVKRRLSRFFPVMAGAIILEKVEDKFFILKEQEKLKNKPIDQIDPIFSYRGRRLKYKEAGNPSDMDLENIATANFQYLKFTLKILCKIIVLIFLFYLGLNLLILYFGVDFYPCSSISDYKKLFLTDPENYEAKFCFCAHGDTSSLENEALSSECVKVKWNLMFRDLFNAFAGIYTMSTGYVLSKFIEKIMENSPFFFKSYKGLFKMIIGLLAGLANIFLQTYYARTKNPISNFARSFISVFFRGEINRVESMSLHWVYKTGYHVMVWMLAEIIFYSIISPYLLKFRFYLNKQKLMKINSFQYEILTNLQPVEFGFEIKTVRTGCICMAGLFFGSAMPILYILLFLNFVFEGFFAKKNFFTICKRPKSLNSLSAQFCVTLFGLAPFIILLGCRNLLSNDEIWPSNTRYVVKSIFGIGIPGGDFAMLIIIFSLIIILLERVITLFTQIFRNKLKKIEKLEKIYRKQKLTLNEPDLRFSQVAYKTAHYENISFHLEDCEIYKDIAHTIVIEERTMHREYKNSGDDIFDNEANQSDHILLSDAKDLYSSEKLSEGIENSHSYSANQSSENEIVQSAIFGNLLAEERVQVRSRKNYEIQKKESSNISLGDNFNPFKKILKEIRLRKQSSIQGQVDGLMKQRQRRPSMKKFELKAFKDVALMALEQEKQKNPQIQQNSDTGSESDSDSQSESDLEVPRFEKQAEKLLSIPETKAKLDNDSDTRTENINVGKIAEFEISDLKEKDENFGWNFSQEKSSEKVPSQISQPSKIEGSNVTSTQNFVEMISIKGRDGISSNNQTQEFQHVAIDENKINSSNIEKIMIRKVESLKPSTEKVSQSRNKQLSNEYPLRKLESSFGKSKAFRSVLHDTGKNLINPNPKILQSNLSSHDWDKEVIEK